MRARKSRAGSSDLSPRVCASNRPLAAKNEHRFRMGVASAKTCLPLSVFRMPELNHVAAKLYVELQIRFSRSRKGKCKCFIKMKLQIMYELHHTLVLLSSDVSTLAALKGRSASLRPDANDINICVGNSVLPNARRGKDSLKKVVR